jgi:hypothetical protein
MITQDNKIKAECVLRFLQIFKDRDEPVFFKFDEGPEKGAFKNGKIIDLSPNKLTLVLDEWKDGIKPYFLEWINSDTITKSEKDFTGRIVRGDKEY